MTELPPADKEVRVILGYASSKCYTSFALYKLLLCIRTQRNCIAAQLRLRMLWGVILKFPGGGFHSKTYTGTRRTFRVVSLERSTPGASAKPFRVLNPTIYHRT